MSIVKEVYGKYINGIYNACCIVKGYDKPVRARSEMLVIKDDKVFISFGEDRYKLPGGSWNENESSLDAAIRETKEEVRICCKDVVYSGCYLIRDKVHPWVKENIPEEEQWHGYYTEVFIGYYDGEYTGFVAECDQDDIINTGRFYPIEEVYYKLREEHKRALSMIRKS